MSGATARNPRLANTGSCPRQEIDSSGQPCTKMIGVACAGPHERKNVVCRGVLATCSRIGKFMLVSDLNCLPELSEEMDHRRVDLGRPFLLGPVATARQRDRRPQAGRPCLQVGDGLL